MSEKLTKSERLRGEKRIEALFRSGRRGAVGPVRYCFLVSDAEPGSPVSVLFSVPKKIFKRAWARNLLKRRMRESYRTRKGALVELAAARGLHIEIALICAPASGSPTAPEPPKTRPETRASQASGAVAGTRSAVAGAPAPSRRTPKNSPRPRPEVPDFKTIDNAIERILEQIAARV